MNNFPAGTEDNVGTGSALVPTTVAARATIDLVLDERQQTTRTVDWLEPLADDAVKAYLRDKRADPVIAAQLKAAWEIRQVLARRRRGERQKLASEEAERRRATEETRANLKALEKNTAAARPAREADRTAGGGFEQARRAGQAADRGEPEDQREPGSLQRRDPRDQAAAAARRRISPTVPRCAERRPARRPPPDSRRRLRRQIRRQARASSSARR